MTTLLPDTTVDAPGRADTARGKRWEYWALAALLIGTAIAYLWDLGASGWANSFYTAAVQAGSQSWEAFFFGSSDAANSITVDKPPASLWLMALSVRIFGLSSWAILVPQALLGVASVAMLWATVRRYFGPVAGLLAGLVLAVTPVAALMFRFNNPDALLVFLMIGAVWALMRAVEDGRTRWIVLTGVFVGFGFLTKQLQVMLVVPPLALTYLIAGPPQLGKRMAQLFAAAGAMIVSAGWWIAIVELWPASSRPWIGGSQSNSILELTFGYNGLGRLNGNETGSVTPSGGMDANGAMDAGGGMPGGGAGGMWGSTGITRMFEAAQGGQVAWLLPAALVLLVAGIVLRGRNSRTDPTRAALIVWGGWLIVTALTFSFMAGIFHAYYTVALAPAVAALVGGGSVLLWRHRDLLWVRLTGAATLLTTGATAWILLSRSADFVPWLRWVVVLAAVVAAGLFTVPTLSRRVAAVAIGAALIAGLGGPVAYSAQTISTPHTGSIVSAGPTVESGRGGMGMPGGRDDGRFGDGTARVGGTGATGQGGTTVPGGMTGAGGSTVSGGATAPGSATAPDGATGSGGDGGGMFGGAGGAGGLLNGSQPSAELTALLEEDAEQFTWIAATVGANSAAGYQLATERPVMPIGGFNGTDPSPTLGQFQQYVAEGKIHWFIAGGFGGGGRDGASTTIAEWVEQNFTATEVDGVTLYDLTAPVS